MRFEMLECNECGSREWTILDKHVSQEGDGCMVADCDGIYNKKFEVK